MADLLDLIYKKKPIFIDLNQNSSRSSFAIKDESLIGIKLNLRIEIMRSLLFLPKINNSLADVMDLISENGLKISRIVAVYPNLNSPKFVLPFKDAHSHRFLIRDLYLPRRYSLNFLTRIKLQLYSMLLSLTKNTSIFHPYCFIFIGKDE